ncbi:hypothetical protein [Rubrolithibacter danxiaensis]|uniref:hypothetical protein n=1 Tax=Rubrolithibacter danxiaensis TaxID=3390805 RepID=UPI003BF7BAA9
MATVKADDILLEIKQLSFPDKIYILEKIVSLIKKDNLEETEAKLYSLKGLGAEVWKDVDIDEYIKKEREWD